MSMNRKDFLAFIPSLMAMPLVGQNIIQTPDKIEIIKPKPLEMGLNKFPTIDQFNLYDCEVQVIHKSGKVLGSGYLKTLSFSNDYIGPRTIEIEAYLYDFTI